MNLKTFLKRGRPLAYSQTCQIKRSLGNASDYGEPAVVHSSLRCSYIHEISDEEFEKGWLATVSHPLKMYVEAPTTGTIKQHDIVVVNGENYFVVMVRRHPHSSPSHYELYVDHRRGQ